MAQCEICGKAPHAGNAVSHSNRHTKTTWHPNVHRLRIMLGGKRQRVYICTRCLRSRHKAEAQAP